MLDLASPKASGAPAAAGTSDSPETHAASGSRLRRPVPVKFHAHPGISTRPSSWARSAAANAERQNDGPGCRERARRACQTRGPGTTSGARARRGSAVLSRAVGRSSVGRPRGNGRTPSGEHRFRCPRFGGRRRASAARQIAESARRTHLAPPCRPRCADQCAGNAALVGAGRNSQNSPRRCGAERAPSRAAATGPIRIRRRCASQCCGAARALIGMRAPGIRVPSRGRCFSLSQARHPSGAVRKRLDSKRVAARASARQGLVGVSAPRHNVPAARVRAAGPRSHRPARECSLPRRRESECARGVSSGPQGRRVGSRLERFKRRTRTTGSRCWRVTRTTKERATVRNHRGAPRVEHRTPAQARSSRPSRDSMRRRAARGDSAGGRLPTAGGGHQYERERARGPAIGASVSRVGPQVHVCRARRTVRQRRTASSQHDSRTKPPERRRAGVGAAGAATVGLHSRATASHPQRRAPERALASPGGARRSLVAERPVRGSPKRLGERLRRCLRAARGEPRARPDCSTQACSLAGLGSNSLPADAFLRGGLRAAPVERTRPAGRGPRARTARSSSSAPCRRARPPG
jgi:hypothetical protein